MEGLGALFSSAQNVPGNPSTLGTALALLAYVVLGGVFSLWVRWLYRRYGTAISNRESMSSVFSLLTLTVIVVIFVVKDSLALSLGLVGALSIVRFRAAIKEPEELIYLFFCIAMGLALGAERPLTAVAGLLGFTVFVLLRHRRATGGGRQHHLLTISGPADGFLEQVPAILHEALGKHKLQRFDLEDGQVQMRVVAPPTASSEVLNLANTLQSRLPGCQVSFVNLETLL